MHYRLDLSFSFVIIGLILLLIIPVSPVVLDLLFSLSLVLSLMTLLLTLYVKKTLDFSAFPSLLLFLTLFRLGLNIASTRLILTFGEAGAIIKTFGCFLTQGHFIVGLTIFLLLSFINFIVVTKGASRVAEVAARFSLESLPGKQMAIDSQVVQGSLRHSEAEQARKRLKEESEFYGAMDGASKFVKGDAVVALLITFVNLIGGGVIGVFVNKISLSSSLQLYGMLTIGDGLLSQIPALLTSIASGVIVTRSSSESLGHSLSNQLIQKPLILFKAALFLFFLLWIPGMPKGVLSCVALAFTLLGVFCFKKHQSFKIKKSKGFLAPLVVLCFKKTPALASAWEKTAQSIADEMGVVLIDPIFEENSSLPKGHVILKIRGSNVLEKKSSEFSKNLKSTLLKHLHLLITRQDVYEMVEKAKQIDSAVVEELFFKKMSYGQLLKVLKNLLKEQIPIKDFITILETCADGLFGEKKVDLDLLTEKVRSALSHHFSSLFFSKESKTYILTIDPHVESLLEVSFSKKEGVERWSLKPQLRSALLHKIQEAKTKTHHPFLVTSHNTRLLWKKFLEHEKIELKVFSHKEIAHSVQLEIIDEISSDILI